MANRVVRLPLAIADWPFAIRDWRSAPIADRLATHYGLDAAQIEKDLTVALAQLASDNARKYGDGLVELTFQIVEHRKVLVQRIDITGNDHLADRKINSRKGNKLPEEAGLKLLRRPAVPREVPVTHLIKNHHKVRDWEMFLSGGTGVFEV